MVGGAPAAVLPPWERGFRLDAGAVCGRDRYNQGDLPEDRRALIPRATPREVDALSKLGECKIGNINAGRHVDGGGDFVDGGDGGEQQRVCLQGLRQEQRPESLYNRERSTDRDGGLIPTHRTLPEGLQR